MSILRSWVKLLSCVLWGIPSDLYRYLVQETRKFVQSHLNIPKATPGWKRKVLGLVTATTWLKIKRARFGKRHLQLAGDVESPAAAETLPRMHRKDACETSDGGSLTRWPAPPRFAFRPSCCLERADFHVSS